jgi:hypothetical protein
MWWLGITSSGHVNLGAASRSHFLRASKWRPPAVRTGVSAGGSRPSGAKSDVLTTGLLDRGLAWQQLRGCAPHDRTVGHARHARGVGDAELARGDRQDPAGTPGGAPRTRGRRRRRPVASPASTGGSGPSSRSSATWPTMPLHVTERWTGRGAAGWRVAAARRARSRRPTAITGRRCSTPPGRLGRRLPRRRAPMRPAGRPAT